MGGNTLWPTVPLGRYAYIKARIGWRGLSSSEYTEEGPYLIAGNHIIGGRVNWSSCDHLPMRRYQESLEIALQVDDVILTKDGTIGRIAIIDYLPGLATINGTMMLVRAHKPLLARYVYHYLTSRAFLKLVEERVSGSSIPHIFQRDLVNLAIPIPLESEQRLIAEILDTIDETIQQTEALIAKLKLMKQGFLHDLLTCGLDEYGQLRDPVAHPEHFKDSELGRLPNQWDIVPIYQAAAKEDGSTTIGPFGSNLLATDYRSVGIPVIFVRDVKANRFKWNSDVYLDSRKANELSLHSVSSGDLLATKMGLPPCIACAYPHWMPDGIITADIIRLRPNTIITNSQWLAYFVNSDSVIRQVRTITGGVTRPKITLKDFRKLMIALPPLEEQKRILCSLNTHDTRIRTEEEYCDKLKLQKQGLVHDLLTGRVQVNVAETMV